MTQQPVPTPDATVGSVQLQIALLDYQDRAPGIRRLRHHVLARATASPGGTAVDVGSGTGSVVPLLRELVGETGRVVGVEPNPVLRELAGALDNDTAALVATSLGLANWHRTHPRCSLCGTPTQPDLAGWIRRCPDDASEHYPRTDVAVIMAVTDPDDRLLLGRAPSWPTGRMSILAGFVEPGETLEQAVAREVREEVGIDIHDVEYVDDQPWPFPSSLMVGFTARTNQTELCLDEAELAEARWVSRGEVATLIAAGEYRPSPGFSISRLLVEDWYGDRLPTRRAGR